MAKKPRPFVGPPRDPSRPRSIFCRACAKDVSRRTDGTWRHDHDGTVLDGVDGRCRNPEQIYADADARSAERDASGTLAPVNPGRYDVVEEILADALDSQGEPR